MKFLFTTLTVLQEGAVEVISDDLRSCPRPPGGVTEILLERTLLSLSEPIWELSTGLCDWELASRRHPRGRLAISNLCLRPLKSGLGGATNGSSILI
jgi:hypothetical protein